MVFRNNYYFLSNMFPCTISYNGKTYKCVEAAFQAQKDLNSSLNFTEVDGFTAKKYGRKVNLRKDWNSVRVAIMKEILIAKFTQNPELLFKLKEITEPIIEENTWNDTFWGVCRGRGENHLGKLLEEVKFELEVFEG